MVKENPSLLQTFLLTTPETEFVMHVESGEKQVRKPRNFAFSFRDAQRVHNTPITTKSHAYARPFNSEKRNNKVTPFSLIVNYLNNSDADKCKKAKSSGRRNQRRRKGGEEAGNEKRVSGTVPRTQPTKRKHGEH